MPVRYVVASPIFIGSLEYKRFSYERQSRRWLRKIT